MELQFQKSVHPCLQWVKHEIQDQEQTQELRLEDGMPDIGRVLGAWGQALVRGKEWRSGSMQASCGVMAWVLYVPEDGSGVQCVQTWIPFQLKWDIPDTERDGTMEVGCLLKNIDARSTSARKLMVRANLGVMGGAMIPGELSCYTPDELPEDVQILKNTYLLRLPREAGEKPFQIDEELVLPGSVPQMEKLLRFQLQPELIDKKVMGSKVVFRGTALLHVLYLGTDSNLYTWDHDLPFSQYAELDRDYDQDAAARVTLAVTSLELDPMENGRLNLKAGLTGQYVIDDTTAVEAVEDAYSPRRAVTIRTEAQQVPVILDESSQTIHAEQSVQWDGGRIVDVSFCPDHARIVRNEFGMEAELPGQFQMLCYDAEGNLQTVMPRWEGSWSLSAGENARIYGNTTPSGRPQAGSLGGNAQLNADVLLQTLTTAQQGIPVVTGLELGEMTEPDPNRPSLILRKVGNDKLWDVAKRTGSTVDAIREANHLTDDSAEQKILLIPIS